MLDTDSASQKFYRCDILQNHVWFDIFPLVHCCFSEEIHIYVEAINNTISYDMDISLSIKTLTPFHGAEFVTEVIFFSSVDELHCE
jgi:hypothetical protein